MMSDLEELLPTKRPRLTTDFSKCVICQFETEERFTTPTEDGLDSLLKCIESKKDRVYSLLWAEIENLNRSDLKYHRSCYKNYTRRAKCLSSTPKTSKCRDLKRHESSFVTPSPARTPLRNVSQTRASSNHAARFDVSKCVICQQDRNHHGKSGKDKLVQVQTESFAKKLMETAEKKQDLNDVFLRLSGLNIVAAGVKYHDSCRTSYVTSDSMSSPGELKQETDTDENMNDWTKAFDQLIQEIDGILKEGDRLELSPVCNRFNHLLGENGDRDDNLCRCDNRRLKTSLIRHYGDGIKFTNGPSSQLMYASSVTVGETMRKMHNLRIEREDNLLEEDLSVDEQDGNSVSLLYHTGVKIRDDLKRQQTHFQADEISRENARQCVPDSLYMLLKYILAEDKDDLHETSPDPREEVDKAILNIGQDIVYQASKKRCTTPKHVGIALTVHQATRSKSLIQLLHAAGHCVSYEHLQRVDTAMARKHLDQFEATNVILPPNITQGSFVEFAGDNIDILEETLDGKNTFHATQMAAFQTQQGSVVRTAATLPVPGRQRVLKTSQSSFHEIITVGKTFGHPKPNFPHRDPSGLLHEGKPGQFHHADLAWLLSRNFSHREQVVPSWTAFNQFLSPKDETKSVIGYMPIIRAPAHELDTLWTVILRAQNVAHYVGQRYTIITFDQALYCKAKELTWLRPEDCQDTIIRLGGFHTSMNFLRCIGQHFADSGLADAWIESGLYSECTANKIMAGKSWNRAIRAHKLTAEALWRCIWPRLTEELPALIEVTDELPLDSIVSACRSNNPEAVKSAFNSMRPEMHSILCMLEEFEDANCDNSMTMYWVMYLKMVSTLLSFVRAEREGDWHQHLSSLAEMLPWFAVYDHNNYARWAPVYLQDMQLLPETAPEVYQQYLSGHFGVKHGTKSFSRIPTDQALEHVNRTGKIAGGLVGITQTESALDKWCLTYNDRTHLTESTYTMLGLNLDKDSWAHKETGKARRNRDEEDVRRLATQFQQYRVFGIDGPDLLCLSSRDVAPPTIRDDLLSAFANGKELVAKYLDDRLNPSAPLAFYDRLKKVKSKTFAEMYTVKTAAKDGKEGNIKADRDLYRRLLAAVKSGRTVDVDDLVKHELAPVPRSLAGTDGSMHPADKAPLIHLLAGEMAMTQIPKIAVPTCLIIDAMALVQAIGKPSGAQNFGDLADVICEAVTSKFGTVTRIDVVFDRYREVSIKQATRTRRAGERCPSIQRIIDDRSVPLPTQWQRFINMGTNKANLAAFLSDQFLATKVPDNCELVVAGGYEDGETVSSSIGRSVKHLECTHEEADTRMILHAADTAKAGFHRTVVYSKDTDVLALLIHFVDNLSQEVYMNSGTQKNPRVIPVHAVSQALTKGMREGLLAFHAVTGCDTTSQFAGHGKKGCWKVYTARPALLSHLGRGLLKAKTVADVEQFTVRVHSNSSHQSSINGLRAELFYTKDPESLPPTQDALKQHIRRAHYQAMIWLNSLNARPRLPPATDYGWIEEGGRLRPVLTTLESVPKVCMELVRCGCDKKCSSGNCSCQKHKLGCTDACGCRRVGCLNPHNPVEDEDSDDDEC